MAEDRCSRAMGCDGVKCIWDASGKKCTKWCTAHAEKWVPSLISALDSVTDPQRSALFVIDKLIFENKHGAFVRGSKCDIHRLIEDMPLTSQDDVEAKEQEMVSISRLVSNGMMHVVSAKINICGLVGDVDQKTIEEWEGKYSTFKPHPKTKNVTVEKPVGTGEYVVISDKVSVMNREQTYKAVAAALSDPTVKGVCLFYEFKLLVEDVSLHEMCEAFDAVDPSGEKMYKSVSGCDGKAYLLNPEVAGGGAHLSLDCGTQVVHWHNMTYMLFSMPHAHEGWACVDLVMKW